ncbi:Uncharacterised protein [Mycobacteroides abscessus subsp. abscessus]|nr:Uncharacterised protein [Mycobacteroides abscessus subsp. abscessus]
MRVLTLGLGGHGLLALGVGALVVEASVLERDLLVPELPVPLECGDVDDDLRVGVLVHDLVLHHDGEVEEHRDDQEGHHRQDQLQRQVVPELTRELGVARLVAVERDGPEGQTPHDDADDQRGDDRPGPQGGHVVVCFGGDALGPAEPQHLLDATTAEQEARRAQQHHSGQQGRP